MLFTSNRDKPEVVLDSIPGGTLTGPCKTVFFTLYGGPEWWDQWRLVEEQFARLGRGGDDQQSCAEP
jgi:hypothetical protein